MKMATVSRSTVLSISVLVAGCSPADIAVHPAVVQGGCPPMQVVPIGSPQDSTSPPCQMAKEVKSLFDGIAQAVSTTPSAAVVVTGNSTSSSRPRVIERVVVKRGQGLIAATRKTKLPLTLSEANDVGKKYNRTFFYGVTAQNVVTIGALLSPGEEIFLVEERGKRYWVLGRMP